MPEDAISDARLRELLTGIHRIAVLGASARVDRPSYRVADYLVRHGYAVHAVSPAHAGTVLHGHAAVSRLTDLEPPIDLVDVFRRAEDVPGHVAEVLAMRPLPAVVWLQLGIRNDEAAAALRRRGITVVQDRCAKIEHARLLRPERAEGRS